MHSLLDVSGVHPERNADLLELSQEPFLVLRLDQHHTFTLDDRVTQHVQVEFIVQLTKDWELLLSRRPNEVGFPSAEEISL